jgi:hypothetical protein
VVHMQNVGEHVVVDMYNLLDDQYEDQLKLEQEYKCWRCTPETQKPDLVVADNDVNYYPFVCLVRRRFDVVLCF